MSGWTQTASLALAAAAATGAFGFTLTRMNLLNLGRRTVASSLHGVTAMLDPELPDREKERALRGAGGALLLTAVRLTAWLAVSGLAAFAVIVLTSVLLGLAIGEVWRFMLTVEFVLGASLVAIIIWRVARTRSDAKSTDQQSEADQLVHTLAFASPWLAKALASLDGLVASRALKLQTEIPLIFITSLPRAGTTALLNAIHSLPQTAAHEYRDMPFAMAPFLWSKLGGTRKVTARARAHGDGLTIGLDSPEAFDEILWKLYWPKKYKSQQIELWRAADTTPEKLAPLIRNFKTIGALRSVHEPGLPKTRYVSKNNANIARLPLLKAAFPSAHIIVPLRRPGPQAASMCRQHLNFLSRHAEDTFSKRYMRDLGHFEFGALHRPIAFPGQAENPYEPSDANYWLAYWIAAFREVRRQKSACIFVTQDALRSNPQGVMCRLAKLTDLDIGTLQLSHHFRRTPDVCDESVFDPELICEADRLYADLASFSIQPERNGVS